MSSTNAERLQAAGMVKKTPLPERYESIINDLSEQEVDALVSVGTRLRDANDVDDTPRTLGFGERHDYENTMKPSAPISESGKEAT